ncbi:alpha/beta-hydrolase [Coniochaeta sp. PMI_546]|nr:alpha/beta-hydrolase [Coniochaeta sp. PMI_546]
MTTPNPFGTVPQAAPGKPEPFNLRVSDEDLSPQVPPPALQHRSPDLREPQRRQARPRPHPRLARLRQDRLGTRLRLARPRGPHQLLPKLQDPPRRRAVRRAGHALRGPLLDQAGRHAPSSSCTGGRAPFAEFLPVLDLLREKYTPHTLPYHVVVPSLPGYTLSSGPPVDRDFGIEDAARYMNTLMVQLGFGKGYVAQGGDVGYFVGSVMSSAFEECKALHVNFLLLHPPASPEITQGLNPHDLKLLEKAAQWRTTGSGYALEHATRPATIGLALSSSPLALLAWTAEKFIDDSDEPLPLAVVLRMVSLYWFTDSLPRSLYPYRAALLGPDGVRMCREKPLG